MSKKKKVKRIDSADALQERLAKAREKRIAMAKASFDKQEAAAGKDEFDRYWARARREYNRSKELGDAVWAHLKAIGHNKPSKFEAGIKHFGLKK